MSAVARRFVLRTPLLPLEAAFAATHRAPLAVDRDAELDDAIAADRQEFWRGARRLLDDPDVREALALASPSFAESLRSWEKDPNDARAADVEPALVRYLQRMASRPTPFGLFAGQTVGVVSERTELRLASRARYRRTTRLRRGALEAIARAAPAGTALRSNPTLHRAGDGARALRYVDAASPQSLGGRAVSILVGEEVERVLAHASETRERAELVDLAVREGAEPEEASALVDDLVATGLVATEHEPALSGDDPARAFLRELRARAALWAPSERIGRALDALDTINARAELAWPASTHAALAETLGSVPDLDPSPGRALSVTLSKPADVATLAEEAVARIDAAARALAAMGFARQEDPLRAFRDAFRARFEGEEVPLLVAVDRETGVGASLTDEPPPATVPPPRLVRLLGDALATHARDVVLGPDDCAALARRGARPLPAAYAAIAQIARDPNGGPPSLHLQGASGPSGGRLLGRFAHDPSVRELLDEHLRAEEALDPDAVFAEVIHAPPGDAADAVVRPVLRAFEIPCFARSAAPAGRRIELADLRVSVRGDRVMLRSASLGRRVIPRGTHAHHYASSPVLAYRLLGALQEQGVAGDVAWDWGALGAASYLPRVVVEGVVVSLARWRLSAVEQRALAGSRGRALVRAATAMRAARALPRFVSIDDGDRVAWIDLESVVSLEAAARLLGRGDGCTLREVFGPPDAACVAGDGGSFAHELVIPFVTEGAVEPPVTSTPARAITSRVYPPGSEWLYARLEADDAAHDRLLADVVAPVIGEGRASGAIDRWFFVRHADPAPHLRVRFHGDPGRLCADVLPALTRASAPALREGALVRLTLDTYVREVERYGGSRGIDLAEHVFQADSEAALQIATGLAGPAPRRHAALVGVDRLLEDLGLRLEARLALVTRLADACRVELEVDEAVARTLDARFRAERAALELLRDRRDPRGSALHDVLSERSRALAPLVAALDEAAPDGSLAATFAHVHVGRMLSGGGRPAELLVYDFLRRLYRSEIARHRREAADV